MAAWNDEREVAWTGVMTEKLGWSGVAMMWLFSNQVDGGAVPRFDLSEFDEHCERVGIDSATTRKGIGSASALAKLRRAYRETAFATHPDKKQPNVQDYWNMDLLEAWRRSRWLVKGLLRIYKSTLSVV